MDQNPDSRRNTPIATERRDKGRIFRRVARIVGWSVAAIVSLVLLVLTCCVWILTPGRLTPLITHIVNENIEGTLELHRAELFFWHTFPQLHIELDSISITSSAFDSLSPEMRAQLPADADTLLRIGRFRAGVNIAALAAGKIKLSDVTLADAMINAVSCDSVLNNYTLVPSNEEAEVEEEGRILLPDISISRVYIVDVMPVRYRSLADSIDINVGFERISLDGNGAPLYAMDLVSDVNVSLPDSMDLNEVAVKFDGSIEWSCDDPQTVALRDFTVMVGEIPVKIATAVDFADGCVVEDFDASLGPVTIETARQLLPVRYGDVLRDFDSDLALTVGAELTSPFRVAVDSIPNARVTVDIPRCSAIYDNDYRVDAFELRASATMDGNDLDASVLNVDRLYVASAGVGLELDGTVGSVSSNPYVDTRIKGYADLSRLPKRLKRLVSGSIVGILNIDTRARVRVSDLSRSGFHKALVNGNVELRNFGIEFPDSAMNIKAGLARLRFGTNNSFVSDDSRVDSLLTLSVKIDTVSLAMPGLELEVKSLAAGIGCANTANSTDTTIVNPIGATIMLAGARLVSADSLAVSLRNAHVRASLKRYNDEARVPLLSLDIGADRAFYADRFNRVTLREGRFDVTAHLQPRRQLRGRLKARYDSIVASNPEISPDSVMAILRASRSTRITDADSSQYEVLDLGVDNSLRRLLRRWAVTGDIKAKGGRMFTPYFPLRNRLTSVDIGFTTDSLLLRNIRCISGRSDFMLSGSVHNILRAMGNRSPLQVRIELSSDTIDVNQIVDAVFAGAAFADKVDSGAMTVTIDEDEARLDAMADSAAATGQTAAVLIPVNVHADIEMRSHNIIYADMAMTDFAGNVEVNRGALNLSNLSASTDFGSLDLTALYSAPRKSDIRFGFGMKLENINIHRFLNLVPSIDSIMPLLASIEGIIDVDMAMATDVDSAMNIELPTLEAALKLSGDSLVLLDDETFKTIAKWLLLKNRKTNMIGHMDVELMVKDSMMELFPFTFDFDRYKLAVMGYNDLALNFDYHISVLKSPLPFKFGINMSGNPDKFKVRLGGAKFKPDQTFERRAIVETARVNLLKEIQDVFKRGVTAARLGHLYIERPASILSVDLRSDSLSRADSLLFINEGLIENPSKLDIKSHD